MIRTRLILRFFRGYHAAALGGKQCRHNWSNNTAIKTPINTSVYLKKEEKSNNKKTQRPAKTAKKCEKRRTKRQHKNNEKEYTHLIPSSLPSTRSRSYLFTWCIIYQVEYMYYIPRRIYAAVVPLLLLFLYAVSHLELFFPFPARVSLQSRTQSGSRGQHASLVFPAITAELIIVFRTACGVKTKGNSSSSGVLLTMPMGLRHIIPVGGTSRQTFTNARQNYPARAR